MMNKKYIGRIVFHWLIPSVAVLFGIMTIISGGSVLFGDQAALEAAGDVVPFVLWFNFAAGFIYIIAGIALALRKPWSAWLSLIIAATTLLVFAALGIHIFSEGAYETRTVAAMTLRSTVWTAIFILTYRQLIRREV